VPNIEVFFSYDAGINVSEEFSASIFSVEESFILNKEAVGECAQEIRMDTVTAKSKNLIVRMR
jgi:hypothetical protein